MLRMSEERRANQSLTLRLEGRLVGPWVDELRQICEPLLADETKLALDLAEVSFADEGGAALLKSLERRGTKLSKPSPFLSEQLKASAAPAAR